jgi:hypothetical protein
MANEKILGERDAATARALGVLAVEARESFEKAERLRAIVYALAEAHGVQLPDDSEA